MSDTFPRQYARTQRLTLGEPRNFTVSPDGARVLFVRSHGGSDSVNTLWVIDTATGVERELLDPRTLATDLSALTPEELRRRERARAFLARSSARSPERRRNARFVSKS